MGAMVRADLPQITSSLSNKSRANHHVPEKSRNQLSSLKKYDSRVSLLMKGLGIMTKKSLGGKDRLKMVSLLCLAVGNKLISHWLGR
jgi:hypothetical protein